MVSGTFSASMLKGVYSTVIRSLCKLKPLTVLKVYATLNAHVVPFGFEADASEWGIFLFRSLGSRSAMVVISTEIKQ